MNLGPTLIDDTFAEAFRMVYARIVVTAHDDYWLRAATSEFTGYGSSIIGCDAEAGVERWLPASETPDRRPGAAILAFGFSASNLAKAVLNRTGQSLMTCPTTAVFDGLPAAVERAPLGKSLRYFGDGFQKSKLVDGRRYWRIPVMDGEMLVEESLGIEKGIAGGNIILQSATLEAGLSAARRGVEAVAAMAGAITPFPGGVARSGSKVGSRYKALRASTADAFCPTLRGRVESKVHPEANYCHEIVIDGVDEATVGQAMARAMRAAADGGDTGTATAGSSESRSGVIAISAGNYGGRLGKFHFHLRELLKQTDAEPS